MVKWLKIGLNGIGTNIGENFMMKKITHVLIVDTQHIDVGKNGIMDILDSVHIVTQIGERVNAKI